MGSYSKLTQNPIPDRLISADKLLGTAHGEIRKLESLKVEDKVISMAEITEKHCAGVESTKPSALYTI